jgi:hypothetical protein
VPGRFLGGRQGQVEGSPEVFGGADQTPHEASRLPCPGDLRLGSRPSLLDGRSRPGAGRLGHLVDLREITYDAVVEILAPLLGRELCFSRLVLQEAPVHPHARNALTACSLYSPGARRT